MDVEIAKWGNSLALRIPAKLAKQSGLIKGTKADITVRNGKLIITPDRKQDRQARLKQMLASLEVTAPIGEIASGAERGNEVYEW